MARLHIKPATLHFWHRTVGIGSALFVLLLASTGLLLNHSSTLKLDQQPVQSELLLKLYRIGQGVEVRSVRVAGHWISKLDGRCYLDRRFVTDVDGELIGAVMKGGVLVVGLGGKILLLTTEAMVVEVLGAADGVPEGLRRIGLDDRGRVLIHAAHGDYRVDLETLEWQEVSSQTGIWSLPASAPAALRAALLSDYRGKGLPLERVLLDVHSGRILGAWGIYLIDGVALIFLLLAGSGIWMWARRRR